jgi:hypothetical protein
MSTPFDMYREIKVHGRGPVVDLQLAQTYVPGLYCLLRSSIVILLMTRANVSEDMSLLLVMSIIIYVDRTFRRESIFDSNAVTISVLLSHMLNLLRIRYPHTVHPHTRVKLDVIFTPENRCWNFRLFT